MREEEEVNKYQYVFPRILLKKRKVNFELQAKIWKYVLISGAVELGTEPCIGLKNGKIM